MSIVYLATLMTVKRSTVKPALDFREQFDKKCPADQMKIVNMRNTLYDSVLFDKFYSI